MEVLQTVASKAINSKLAIQKREELECLVELLQTRDLHTVLEIGTQQGGTLWLWCQIAEPDATIISIDLPSGHADVDPNKMLTWTKDQQTMYLIRENSQFPSTRATFHRYLGDRKLDLLFIDGDHTYLGAKSDYTLYAPFVAPDGFIVFHDIVKHDDETNEVGRLWQEVKREHPCWYEFTSEADKRWGGIGAVRVRRGE